MEGNSELSVNRCECSKLKALKFRNYTPISKELKDQVLPRKPAPSLDTDIELITAKIKEEAMKQV